MENEKQANFYKKRKKKKKGFISKLEIKHKQFN